MAKRDIVTSIASVTAAITAWKEIGRDFKLGDSTCGEVGPIQTVGRIALQVTGATLAYVLTDCSFEWLFKTKDKIIAGIQEGKKESEEDTEDETKDIPVEWECDEMAECIDECDTCDKYLENCKESSNE